MSVTAENSRNLGGRPVGAYGVKRRRQQRFEHLVRSYTAELGDVVSELDKALISQAASIAVHIEKLQADILQGHDVDDDMVIRLSSEHRRLLTSLRGRAVKAKPSAPTIHDLIDALDDEAVA